MGCGVPLAKRAGVVGYEGGNGTYHIGANFSVVVRRLSTRINLKREKNIHFQNNNKNYMIFFEHILS